MLSEVIICGQGLMDVMRGSCDAVEDCPNSLREYSILSRIVLRCEELLDAVGGNTMSMGTIASRPGLLHLVRGYSIS
jgi:hypothetical protein